MKKVFSIIVYVMMIMMLTSICFATGGTTTITRPGTSSGTGIVRIKTISEIKVTVKAPSYGGKLDWEPVMVTDGITFDHMYWEAYNVTDAGGWVGQNKDSIVTNTKYKATIYFTVNSGYKLSDTLTTGTVNSTDGCELVSLSFSPHGIKSYEFLVRNTSGSIPSRPSTTTTTTSTKTEGFNVTIPEVKVGEALPNSGKYKAIPSGTEATFAIPMDNPMMTTSWEPNDAKARPGITYTLTMSLYVAQTALEDDWHFVVNGYEVPAEIKDGNMIATYKVTTPVPEEPNWINQFSVKVTAPKIGEKATTTAKTVTDGFKVAKVVWTPTVTTFKEDVTYTVRVYVTIDADRVLRSDFFGLVNGEQAEMPIDYDKDNFYIEYTFDKLEEKKPWKKASDWAVEELKKANGMSLIPDIFNNADLTTNITRKEFAHVAVKLYEKVSGQKAIAAAVNPFTDTKDTEVLKALNVGITNGTSDTTFSPDALITREQMATMMTRALSKAGIDTTVNMEKVAKFEDHAKMHDWGIPSIYFMSEAGIIKGMGEGMYGVTNEATREQSLLISERSAEKFKK